MKKLLLLFLLVTLLFPTFVYAQTDNQLPAHGVTNTDPVFSLTYIALMIIIFFLVIYYMLWLVRADKERFATTTKQKLEPVKTETKEKEKTDFEVKARMSEGQKRWEEQKRKQAWDDAETKKKFLNQSKDLVPKFLDICERKVSVLDEYGEENWDALYIEIDQLLSKMSKRWVENVIGLNKYQDEYSFDTQVERVKNWEKIHLSNHFERLFRAYHEERKLGTTQNIDSDRIKKLSGVEFETFIQRVLKSNGFEDVIGTPTTRDQGADVIAKKGGKKIVIQAKRYSGTVGNKAVQEIIGAIRYYDADQGWVITNSTFTSSARALASRNKIKLIDGSMLKSISQYLSI